MRYALPCLITGSGGINLVDPGWRSETQPLSAHPAPSRVRGSVPLPELCSPTATRTTLASPLIWPGHPGHESPSENETRPFLTGMDRGAPTRGLHVNQTISAHRSHEISPLSPGFSAHPARPGDYQGCSAGCTISALEQQYPAVGRACSVGKGARYS